MNEEIRRRERAVRIFPNDEAAMRLVGTLLAEKYEEWQASAKYFDMNGFLQWKSEQKYDHVQSKVVSISNLKFGGEENSGSLQQHLDLILAPSIPALKDGVFYENPAKYYPN